MSDSSGGVGLVCGMKRGIFDFPFSGPYYSLSSQRRTPLPICLATLRANNCYRKVEEVGQSLRLTYSKYFEYETLRCDWLGVSTNKREAANGYSNSQVEILTR
jgi:hypothetical protein